LAFGYWLRQNPKLTAEGGSTHASQNRVAWGPLAVLHIFYSVPN
jgi:hypothetical protein